MIQGLGFTLREPIYLTDQFYISLFSLIFPFATSFVPKLFKVYFNIACQKTLKFVDDMTILRIVLARRRQVH